MSHRLENYNGLAEAFFILAEESPDTVVYEQAQVGLNDDLEIPREWHSRTYREVADRVRIISTYLKRIGVQKGDRVAILSYTRPEWMEADIAILSLGAISVSIYQSLPADDIGYILFDSGAEYVFAENQEQLEKLQDLSGRSCEIAATEDREATQTQTTLKRIITFEECKQSNLVVCYRDLITAGDQENFSPEPVERNELAAFVYTSGTTGPPKGVMQTHGNHLSNVRQAMEAGICTEQNTVTLFLPLAHSFAKLIGYIGFLSLTQLKFPAIADPKSSKLTPESVTKDIREAGSDIVPLVPRLLEKMQAGILQKTKSGGVQGFILKTTVNAALEMMEARKRGSAPGLLARTLYEGTAPIRKKICTQLFGSGFQYCISGGAKLSVPTANFFDALGILILQGYGLTETVVATNVNRKDSNRIGTVGPVLSSDIEIKIAADNEIIFRGPNVSPGYYGRPTATAASWDENGWFHTGDLGSVDENGYLTIEGRKKEILVSSYGKNIAPEPIEQEIATLPEISQVVLVGDGRPFCVALITLDSVAVDLWCKNHSYSLNGSFENDPRIRQYVEKHIEHISSGLAGFETPRKFAILPIDFTVDNGFLTPTFKVKRRVVLAEYEDLIESLYA